MTNIKKVHTKEEYIKFLSELCNMVIDKKITPKEASIISTTIKNELKRLD